MSKIQQMLEVKNLTKHYNEYIAIDHLSFKAQSGEILGLLGPNGAGKTTTMRILTGFMPPTEGTARVAGFDILEDSMEVRKRVGYLPERVPVYPDMTVEGFVMFWANLRGIKKARENTLKVLEKVNLIDRRQSLVRNLSKGMRQRLGLAQAIVHDPPVIILDEPTIGIDPQQVIEVRESVRELGKHHTVLFSTHILSEAEQVCDRVIILNKGCIVAEGTPDTLRKKLRTRGSRLYVAMSGAEGKAGRKLLESIPGVESVEVQGEGYVVRAQDGLDIRPTISERLQKAGYSLLELRALDTSLEEIFLDLVGSK